MHKNKKIKRWIWVNGTESIFQLWKIQWRGQCVLPWISNLLRVGKLKGGKDRSYILEMYCSMPY